MKTLCGIQARMSSARLPGKSLLPLNGETVIKRVHDSAKLSDVFYEVVVLTSIDKTDDELCNYLEGQNIKFIRGSLNNVLSRFIDATKVYECSNVVRLTGDNPLIDSNVIKDVVDYHLENNFEYTSNIVKRLIPRGNDVECIQKEALVKLNGYKLLDEDLEHVTLYIRKNPNLFRLGSFEKNYNLNNKNLRLTLDYVEDYKLIVEIYDKLNLSNDQNNIYEIDKLFTNNPYLKKINLEVSQTQINEKSW